MLARTSAPPAPIVPDLDGQHADKAQDASGSPSWADDSAALAERRRSTRQQGGS
jgi:hypothetical protein